MTSESEDIDGQQTFEGGEDGKLEYTVGCEAFSDFVNAVEPITGEAAVKFTPDRIHTVAIDPPNVCLIEAEVADVREANGSATVGLNFERLAEELPAFAPDEPFFITINTNGEDPTVEILGVHGSMEMELIEPDTIREVGGVPSPDFEQEFTMPAYRFHGVFGSLSNTDAQYLLVQPGNGRIWVGGGDDWSGDFEAGEWEVEADTVDRDDVVYSADYVREVCSALPGDGELSVAFGHDLPLRVSSEHSTCLLAPRIRPEESE